MKETYEEFMKRKHKEKYTYEWQALHNWDGKLKDANIPQMNVKIRLSKKPIL